ncbi:MAG: hypothetical protein IJY79_01235, partial [Clostridia bacterium]|nr:hypothetical protein [Clostridia bacterium]
MTKLFKNSKQVLSFVLAFAVLAVSLFTGVVINSDAACADEVVKYWDGTTMTEPTETDTDGNILISSPAELAWLVENGSSSDAKYKVADGIDAFIMQPETVVDAEELMAIDSYEETKTYFETLAASETKPVKWLKKAANYSATGAFLGTFDGNGIEIYGLYYPDKAWNTTALFPHVGANVTIKNLAVRNSYLAIMSYVGAVFGVSADGGNNDRITVDSVAVTGTWIYNNEATLKNNNTPDDTSDDYISYFADRSGMMFGRVGGLIDISNAFVYGNKVTNANNQDLPYAFSPSIKNAWTTTELNHSYSNCVLLGGYPYNPTSYNAYLADLYSNVYTDMAVTEGKYTYNDSQMAQISVDGVKGAAGKSAMNLDWDTVWFANAGMPELRVFHNISDEATPAENGHTVKCADCDLVSVELDHTYGADDKCTACGATRVCGSGVVETWGDAKSTLTGEASSSSEPAWYDNTIELLDPNAENSETNPYIIDSAEGLAWLATKATAAETTGKWYKVADGIKAFNMNTKVDMSGDMTAAEVEAALNTTCQMKTWWGGNFAGSFDGNGVTIYGVQGYNTTYGGSGSLFGKVEAGATFKNFELKNSYFKGDRAGSIFDNANGAGTITVENVVLTGNVLVVTRSNGAESFGGVLFARAGSNKVDVKNCLAYNNIAKHQGYYGEKTGYDVTYGFMGNSSKVNGVNPSIENTIILDCLPFTAQYSYSSTSQATYSNVYTNMIDVEVTNTMQEDGPYTTTYTGGVIIQENGGYKLVVELGNRSNSGKIEDLSGTVGAGSFYAVTAEGIKGAAGKEAMANLDWNNVWFAVEGGMPELRAFHTGFEAATDNGDGTHSETCNCGLVGVAAEHEYEKAAAGGTCKLCGAGCTHGMGDSNYGAYGAFEFSETVAGDCTTAPKGNMICSLCGFT